MKKKILFIMYSLRDGGTEKVLVTMLNHFNYERFDVDLALVSNTGIYLNDVPEQVRVLQFYRQPKTLIERLGGVLYMKLKMSWLEKLLIRRSVNNHYDTIVSFSDGRPLQLHGYLLNRAKRNVNWVHRDLYNWPDNLSSMLSRMRKCYEEMDEVVFVSNGAMRQFAKLNYKLKHSSVIYNPIPVKEIQQSVEYGCSVSAGDLLNHLDNNPIRIVLCGRLSPEKAFDRIIRVAARLRDEHIHFVVNIIGEGEERKRLEHMIESFNLSGWVNLLGFLRPPYPEMAKGDIFVSCSLTEAYPLNVCEALCLGLPIVATECEGNSEVLESGKFGKLVPQDENALFLSVKEMILNKSLRMEYAERSRNAATQFDIDKVMSKVYNVL